MRTSRSVIACAERHMSVRTENARVCSQIVTSKLASKREIKPRPPVSCGWVGTALEQRLCDFGAAIGEGLTPDNGGCHPSQLQSDSVLSHFAGFLLVDAPQLVGAASRRRGRLSA